MPRRRIVYMIGALEVGGTERQLVELATRLDPARFEPAVCCLSGGGPLETRLAARGVPVEIVGARAPAGVGRGLSPVRLWRFLRRRRPDVVHGFLFWGYTSGALVGRLAGVRAVVASRRSLGLGRAARSPYVRLTRLANRLTDLVIANSEAVRQQVIRRERLAERRVIVIPNGVDWSAFAAASDDRLRGALGLSASAPAVGIVANLLPYKGHHVFLEAWGAVVRSFPAAQALLVGDGPLRAELETVTGDMGLSRSVRFLGTRHDIPALLALADLVVHPSLEEGLPNAVLEAMASGKPVVATAVGGTPEAVVDGETGLLVPPGDSPALAAAMIRLLERPADAAAFGRAGRARVVERFDVSKMVRDYEAVYERLLSGSPRNPGAATPRD